ncbi:MAG: EscU/YscU/HrcU family type III secretion system export apparatus switch protein [Gemmatimonadota bacterium]
MQRQTARAWTMAAVTKAGLVITDPTYFAAAIKYLEGRGAP